MCCIVMLCNHSTSSITLKFSIVSSHYVCTCVHGSLGMRLHKQFIAYIVQNKIYRDES